MNISQKSICHYLYVQVIICMSPLLIIAIFPLPLSVSIQNSYNEKTYAWMTCDAYCMIPFAYQRAYNEKSDRVQK